MTEASVAIVGGGITGLSCAYALSRESIDFVLIEARDRLGGTILTERAEGFTLDAGPDAFLAQKPEAVALCRELGLDSRLLPTNPAERAVYVLRRGRLHPLPEGMMLGVPTRILPLAFSRLFSLIGKIRMALEIFIPPRPGEGDESIASFVQRRLGEEALERLAEPLLAGIHSGEPERLSIRSLFPRLVEMERHYGSLTRGMRQAARQIKHTGQVPAVFLSLAGGLSELVEALAARLPPRAALLGDGARTLRREGSCYAVGLSSGREIRALSLVLALPPQAAARLAAEISPGLASELSAIRSVSTAVVFLGLQREEISHPLAGYGFVVPRTEGRRVLAATFVSTKFPNRSPESRVLLRAFVGGARDPQALALSDPELVALARAELETVLGRLGEPIFSRVYRWPEATPQMEVGHQSRLARIESYLREIPGLQVAGNGIRGVGIPDCIGDGRRAAEATAAYLSKGVRSLK